MDGASQLAFNATDPEWTPIDTQPHAQRARVFRQTKTTLHHATATLYVSSSRGFGREPAPTNATRPALTGRRYTIDAARGPKHVMVQGRDYTLYNYSKEPEQLTNPVQLRGDLEPLQIWERETEEPLQRVDQLPLPDPLRHRQFHRWGAFVPPRNSDEYLRIGNASLSNEDFHSIPELGLPDCWYRDTCLDIALEVVSHHHQGDENGIAVASSVTAQCIQFAADCVDETVLNELREYQTMFDDKKWILIPLNDGMLETSAQGIQGNHWALLAIDRPNHSAHYVDGYFRWTTDWQDLAKSFTRAIGNLLNEVYDFHIEWYAPHQWHDNTAIGDGGPCGPYVVKFVHEYMREIRLAQNKGNEENICFGLGFHTDTWFKQSFNSSCERWNLVYTLASYKASQVANKRAAAHDDVALGKPRPEYPVEIHNPASLFCDAPLFDDDAPTCREYQRRNALLAPQGHHRAASSSSKASSIGSGLSTLPDYDDETGAQSGYDGNRDDTNMNEIDMTDRPISPIRDNNETCIEEVSSSSDDGSVLINEITPSHDSQDGIFPVEHTSRWDTPNPRDLGRRRQGIADIRQQFNGESQRRRRSRSISPEAGSSRNVRRETPEQIRRVDDDSDSRPSRPRPVPGNSRNAQGWTSASIQQLFERDEALQVPAKYNPAPERSRSPPSKRCFNRRRSDKDVD